MTTVTKTQREPAEDKSGSSESIRPFRIQVPETEITDLRTRLAATRWPEQAPGDSWDFGVPLEYVKEMAEYWRNGYDWRRYEAKLNAFPQFTTVIDGQRIHFLHVRSQEPNAYPIMLGHGWPGTVAEFITLIEPLTNPRAHGGDSKDAFHVIVPSIPGYGFSGQPTEPGWNRERIAAAYARLMTRLGYERYGVHGGDYSAQIFREMGVQKAPGLEAIHVLQLMSFPKNDPAEQASLTAEEKARMAKVAGFRQRAGYNQIQSSRPQTLAYGLTDSPSGQLAWNTELFALFGDTVDSVDRDLFLTNVMIYWITRTSGSAGRLYYEDARIGAWEKEEPSSVPTAVAVFPGDFQSIPRFAKRANNVVHWKEFDRGGHFAAMEVPDLLIGDLREFFSSFR